MKYRASPTSAACAQNNEDSFGYWEPEDDQQFLRKGRLAIVADGMGGYEGGQEASRLAVETLVAVYRDFGGDDPQQALIEALQAAHEQIRQYSFAHPELRGMGTTCTAVAIVHGACALLRACWRHPALPDPRRADYEGNARPLLCGTAGGGGNDQRGRGGDVIRSGIF